jgi:drug/metabolite transporter (DMT)-like permease
MTAVVRHVSDMGMSATQIVFIRNLLAMSILLPFVLFKRKEIDLKIQNPKLYTLRIVVGITSMILWFEGLGRLPLANATALSFTTPIFVSILAVLLLKEKMGWHRWLAVFIGFVGALIILRPSSESFNNASFYIIAACMFQACALIIVKKMISRETPFNMMFHMHLWMGVVSAPLAFVAWTELSRAELLWCYLIAALSIIGQYGIAKAYSLVEVTLTLPFDFTRLIIAATIAYFAFAEVPDVYSFIGAGIIIISSTYIAYRETRKVKIAPEKR